MRTPAQIAGHPIHPMLVPIPIGLWLFSLVCDFIARSSAAPATWSAASYYAMIGGILGALAAALPGLVDFLSLKGTPVRPTAAKHMGLNLTIVVLYVINAWMRSHAADYAAAGTPMVLSVIGILMLLVSGWLGGKMVFEAGVAVHAADTAVGTTTDAWGDRRSSAARGGMMPGARMDHAMASDTERPARAREDRPAAGSSVDTPRE